MIESPTPRIMSSLNPGSRSGSRLSPRRIARHLVAWTGRVQAELGAWLEACVMSLPGAIGENLRGRYLRTKLRSVGEGCRFCRSLVIHHKQGLAVGDRVGIGAATLNAKGGITIGNDCFIGPGAKIWSINHCFADPNTPIAEQGYEEKPVTIGDDVWIATNAVVLPGVTIGRGAVIGAGAVVTMDVEPMTVVAGVPARPIKKRC